MCQQAVSVTGSVLHGLALCVDRVQWLVWVGGVCVFGC
uniref:Uncharacterized protein n=1 Tax=Anguilla anguilla TaxID=7936 RepID=A0A0E9VCG6_ANGAN